jgi:DNA-binding GntR family transcriptional regulator
MIPSMVAPRPLQRVSTIDALATALRREILDGTLAPGARLRERELCDAYGVARHSLRAALRALAGEGLVRIEPHRGARVAELTADDVRWLYELRAALELEAAHLALERNGGRLPTEVHDALARLEAACAGDDPPWSAITEAHAELHGAIVAAARSPRIAAAHAALSGEMRLFLLALRPHLPAARVAADHVALVRGLEREGATVLREHLRAAAETLVGEGPTGRGARLPDAPPGREEEGKRRPGGWAPPHR